MARVVVMAVHGLRLYSLDDITFQNVGLESLEHRKLNLPTWVSHDGSIRIIMCQ